VPVNPTLGRLRQEDFKFEASLGYITRLCLKNINKNKSTFLEIKDDYSPGEQRQFFPPGLEA
jgi:hypothetical protein